MLQHMQGVTVVAILLFGTIQYAGAQQNSQQLLSDGYRRYNVEFCTITYNLTGMFKGTETITFDRYGLREAKQTRTEFTSGSISVKTNTLTIMDGEITYSINLDDKTGTKMSNAIISSLGKAGERDLVKIGDEMMRQMGAKKTGTEVVAGKTCDRWEIAQMKSVSCVWNSIPLKTEVGLTGVKSGNIASKVDDKTKPGDSTFRIPEEIKIQDKGALPIKKPRPKTN